MTDKDKRGAPRVPYISEVVCEGAGTRLIARTIDLSSSGVFIHSKLCCEAGLILKLRFFVDKTAIEALGEVCYSMPQIGMGVRFIDLKPEYREAIENLIESQRVAEQDKDRSQYRPLIASGVEPVDKLLGGLERSQLFLAHGESSGKSLFGLQFLIEGLNNRKASALITPNSLDSTIKRFSRLGYNCEADLRNGVLVTFRYPHDTAEQVRQHGHLAPLLHELEPLLAQCAPHRIVFDPIDTLLAGDPENVDARVSEFVVWIRSFGATVVVVANGENPEVIEGLTPLVRESFRFEVRESADRVVRYVAFEKSPEIEDQSVRVDPSRGITMLGQTGELTSLMPSDIEMGVESLIETVVPAGHSGELQSIGSEVVDEPTTGPLVSVDTRPPAAKGDQSHEAFFAMLDELQNFASSLEPDANEEGSVHPR
jgi:archaellum biogenesis ATPase FlaH